MEIIGVVPRGYCRGVVNAIQIAEATVKRYPDQPVFMLGMIVHNRYVVDACRKLGIQCLEDPGKTRLELLDSIHSGVVIFTAHGVSDAVRRKAQDKGLLIVDATCEYVTRTHEIVRRHCLDGDVIYIGKHAHPEAEGVTGLSGRVHLIADRADLERLPALTHVLVTTQTTLSILDTRDLLEACRQKYPDAEFEPEVCNATAIRQQAVMNLKDIDVLIVVGDPHSNNSNQLRKIGLDAGIPDAYLIQTCQELKEDMVRNAGRVAVTSGSSTPTALTSQVIDFLQDYAKTGNWVLPPAAVGPVL